MEAIKVDTPLKKPRITTTLEYSTNAAKEHLNVEMSVSKELLDKIVTKEVTSKIQKLNTALG